LKVVKHQGDDEKRGRSKNAFESSPRRRVLLERGGLRIGRRVLSSYEKKILEKGKTGREGFQRERGRDIGEKGGVAVEVSQKRVERTPLLEKKNTEREG